MNKYKLFNRQTSEERKQFFKDFCNEAKGLEVSNREAIEEMLSDKAFLAFVTYHANHDTELTTIVRKTLSQAMINCFEEGLDAGIDYLERLSSISVEAMNITLSDAITTPLGVAADRGGVESIEMFIKKGADINACDRSVGSLSALQMAAYNRIEALKELIEFGAIIDLQNVEGNTALLYASSNQSLEAVELLIAAGADINHKNAANKTALSLVCSSFFEDNNLESIPNLVKIALLLIKLGADIEDPKISEDLNEALDSLEPRAGEEDVIVNLNAADVNMEDLSERQLIFNLLNSLDAARASDSVLSGNEIIPVFHKEYNALFFERTSNAICKSLDFTQYKKLEKYCSEYGLDVTKILGAFVERLFDSWNNGLECRAEGLKSLDDSAINKILFTFKTQACERGINDYDSVIAALNPDFLPTLLIKDIRSLLNKSKEHLDSVESVIRGELEGISIMPASLVKKYIEGDQYYQTDEDTIIYYQHVHQSELEHIGDYLQKLTLPRLIKKIDQLDLLTIQGIVDSYEAMNDQGVILPVGIKKLMQEFVAYWDGSDCDETDVEEVSVALVSSAQSEDKGLKRLREDDDIPEQPNTKWAREENITICCDPTISEMDVIGEISDLA